MVQMTAVCGTHTIMVICLVLSSCVSYIRRLSTRFNCTQPSCKVQDGQIERFLFEPDDEGEKCKRRIRLLHAWCDRWERLDSGHHRVRLPSSVHKYCGVYAVAVKFKEPATWLRFQAEFQAESERAKRGGVYYHVHPVSLNMDESRDDEAEDEDDGPPVVIASLTNDEYSIRRLDLYENASYDFYRSDSAPVNV